MKKNVLVLCGLSYIILTLASFIYSQPNNIETQPIIFIDSSGSMAGFLGKTLYSTFVQDLESTLLLSGVQPNDYLIKRVGSKLIDYKGRLAVFAKDKSLYKEPTTNLVAIADYLRISQPGMAIIISDWELDVASKTQTGDECLSGYDLNCLRTKFSQLIREAKYQLTILAFKSYYSGYLYPPGNYTPIKLNEPIYKPVYLFIFSREDFSSQTNKLLDQMTIYLQKLKKQDPSLEFRRLTIYPIYFPDINIIFKYNELQTNQGKLIFVAEEKKIDKSAINFVFRRVKEMTIKEKINIEIPFTLSQSQEQPINFATRLITSWKPNSKSFPAKINFNDNNVNIVLERAISLGNQDRTLDLRIYAKIDQYSTEIWRDWSTDDPGSSEYRQGQTLYISDLLEYLFKYVVTMTKEPEKEIFTITLMFKY